MRLDSLAAQVAAIAHEAGEAIMKVYNDTADVQVTHKADDSPLTLADRAANEVINNGLAMLQVQYPIISEENKLVDYDVRAAYDTYWLVDPLDGTKEFIKRNGEFTVNIALIRGGEAILGVVYAPVPDEMYWGARGFGAWRMKDGATQKMTATAFSMSDSGLKLVSSRSHLNTETEEYIAQFDAPELVSKGSSFKFLMLASGDAHIYPRIAPTMEWDTAAAQVVLEEAGGAVLDWDTKLPLRYNKPVLRNPFFVALGNLKNG